MLRDAGLTVTVLAATRCRAVLRVDGEIDLATADLITAVAAPQITKERRDLQLNLGGVRFADCAALRAIVSIHNQCLAAGGRLILTELTPPVARLLRVTALDEALHVAGDHRPSSRPAGLKR